MIRVWWVLTALLVLILGVSELLYGAEQTSEEVQFEVKMREVGNLIAKNREIKEGKIEKLEEELKNPGITDKEKNEIFIKLADVYAGIVIRAGDAEKKLIEAEELLDNAGNWFQDGSNIEGIASAVDDMKACVAIYKYVVKFKKMMSVIRFKEYTALAKLTDVQDRMSDLIKKAVGNEDGRPADYLENMFEASYDKRHLYYLALHDIRVMSSPWLVGNGKPEVSNSGEEMLFKDNLAAFRRYVKAISTIEAERIGRLEGELLKKNLTGSRKAEIFTELADAYAEIIVNHEFVEGRLADAEVLLSKAPEWFTNDRKLMEVPSQAFVDEINDLYSSMEKSLGTIQSEVSEQGKEMIETIKTSMTTMNKHFSEVLVRMSEGGTANSDSVLSDFRDYLGLYKIMLKFSKFLNQLEFKRYTAFADISEILLSGDETMDSREFKKMIKRYNDLMAENRSIKIDRIDKHQVADRDKDIIVETRSFTIRSKDKPQVVADRNMDIALAYDEMVRNAKRAIGALNDAMQRLGAGNAAFVDPWELEFRLKKVIGDYVKETGVIYKEIEDNLNAMENNAGDGKDKVEFVKAMEKMVEMSSKSYNEELEELERLRGMSFYRFDRRAVAGPVAERRAFLSSCLEELNSSMKEHQDGFERHMAIDDGNPEHVYVYKTDRWYWHMKGDPLGEKHGLHPAPFDYNAGTGRYIRFDKDSDKWFSFAPMYEGDEVRVDEVR